MWRVVADYRRPWERRNDGGPGDQGPAYVSHDEPSAVRVLDQRQDSAARGRGIERCCAHHPRHSGCRAAGANEGTRSNNQDGSLNMFPALVALAGIVAFAQADRDAHAAKNPLANEPQAVDAGKARFGEACAACHGANAQGGRGPNLTESDQVRQMTDDQLFNTIRRGVPGGGMPAFPLPDNTIWQIVTFLRSLSTPAFFVPVPGDVKAGEAVYRKEQCSSCHMI